MDCVRIQIVSDQILYDVFSCSRIGNEKNGYSGIPLLQENIMEERMIYVHKSFYETHCARRFYRLILVSEKHKEARLWN